MSAPISGITSGLQSRRPAQGRNASDTGDASLKPLSFAARTRHTYWVPFVSPPMSAVGSEPSTCWETVQVAPASDEHSYVKPVTGASAGTVVLMRAPLSSTTTDGFSGVGGGPNGVARTDAGVH